MLGAVAYGLSFPQWDAVALSWLAWAAFIPLFRALATEVNIQRFAGRVLGFLLIAAAVGGWWTVGAVPLRVAPLTTAAVLLETLLMAGPLLALFWLKRRLPYARALLAVVLLWPVWEWAYQYWPFGIRFYLVGNSQAANLWFVQYADLTGVWGITAWVLLVNVWGYELLTRLYAQRRWQGLLLGGLLLFGGPLGYAAWRVPPPAADAPQLRLTLFRTEWPPDARPVSARRADLDTLIRRTEASLAAQPTTDLLAWPESLVDFDLRATGKDTVLAAAVQQWQTPLLFGQIASFAGPSGDTLRANRASLLLPAEGFAWEAATYEKQVLVPFWEGVPFDRWLRRYAWFREYRASQGYYVPGAAPSLLPIATGAGATALLGTPICHEQNVPYLWAEMVRHGANGFALLAYESWFEAASAQTVLAHFTRLRSIETRRPIARVANGGRTLFIDAFGRFGAEAAPNGSVTQALVLGQHRSLFVQRPWLFPALCLLGFVVIGGRAWR